MVLRRWGEGEVQKKRKERRGGVLRIVQYRGQLPHQRGDGCWITGSLRIKGSFNAN